MQYSPLCDTDKEAYILYLFASLLSGDGASADKFVQEYGRDSGNEGGSCQHGYGELAFRLCRGLRVATGCVDCECVAVGAVGCSSCSVGSVSRISVGEGARSDVGMASGDARDNHGGVGCDVTVGQSGHAQSTPGSTTSGRVDRTGGLEPDEVVGNKSVDRGVEPSARTLAGRRKRANRKARAQQARDMEGTPEWRRKPVATGVWPVGCDKLPVDKEVAKSAKEKWIAKNQLEAEEARRKLAVLKANDVEEEARRYRTRVKKHTESNMVKIEKTHAFLRATGNVPGQMPEQVSEVDAGGRIKTVLSGVTISPDSSASQHEVRQMQKDLADATAEIERLRRGIESVKLDPDLIHVYNKSEWTVGSDDFPTDENEKLLDKLYPDGYDRFGDVLKDETGVSRARYVPGF